MNSPDNSSLFGKLRSAAVKAAHGFSKHARALAGLDARTRLGDLDAFNPNSPDPLTVKAKIPRSHFTKRGPGVEAQARRAFDGMTSEQRATARRMGWLQ